MADRPDEGVCDDGCDVKKEEENKKQCPPHPGPLPRGGGEGTVRTRRNRKTEPAYALDYRRELREASTKAEQLVWALIRDRRIDGVKFRRQHTVGRFIVDFVCLEANLVIELDGVSHEFIVDEDKERTAILEEQGFQVIRFWNEDVLRDADAVERAISNVLKGKRKEKVEEE